MRNWISWKPGVIEQYQEKDLSTAKGLLIKPSINERGRWTVTAYRKGEIVYVIEFATIFGCCDWLKENEALEAEV